ncbi:hypothetical protein SPRG_08637 [Saprolegnia parasitica CBS 223.65]|uniref:Uncharacterized protein n=1 Tax=Saprolegnia parasitica (strain CBS 223.65) TaxID=695850 RepID=A0A067C5C0_SAPPC|nr:hypothetical protein SPRG_08637 [Saprolegnia parasitica CBS 223.65]KDO25984.1 hypothetical protein SPRG_08637 [Saprolegnia parasitica CBS 223.65]|eukprot:XP_012203271.1 hypothetical protein SPRG_08637 [Saprolegnia parasitica CBS 223.65]
MQATQDSRCPECHDACRIIARFCPSCGAKMPSAILANKRLAPRIEKLQPPPPKLINGKKKQSKKRPIVALNPLLIAAPAIEPNNQSSVLDPPAKPARKDVVAAVARVPAAMRRGVKHDRGKSEHPVEGWMRRLQELLAKLKSVDRSSSSSPSTSPKKALSRAQKTLLEHTWVSLHTEFDVHFLHEPTLSPDLRAECARLLTHAQTTLSRLAIKEPKEEAPGVVVVKVDGALMRFKSRSVPVKPSISVESALASTVPMPLRPTTMSSVAEPVQPRHTMFLRRDPMHMYTRAYALQSEARVLVSLYESDATTNALRVRIYEPQRATAQDLFLSATDLQRLASPPLYLKRDLPSASVVGLAHWSMWFDTVLRPRLRASVRHHWHIRFPCVYRASSVLYYKGGDRPFRCLLAMHVTIEYHLEVRAFDVCANVLHKTIVPVSHLQTASSSTFPLDVLEPYKWPSLFEALVRQLYIEHTTNGYELVFAGLAPCGRVVATAAPMHTAWATFLDDEHKRLSRLREQCAQLAASVALRRATQRAENDMKARIRLFQSNVCTRIQRHWRGYRGRRRFRNVLYDRALTLCAWGAVPATMLCTQPPFDVFRWFQDPTTLVVHAVPVSTLPKASLLLQPRPSALSIACSTRMRTPYDMHRWVASKALLTLRLTCAAVKIQSHFKRLYCVRAKARRRPASLRWARRIRGTPVLLRLRVLDSGDGLVSVFVPSTSLLAEQVVPQDRLVRGAASIANAIDLFYSAQSRVVTFRVLP